MPYGIARFIGRRQPAIFAALPPTAFLPRKNSTGLFGEGKSDDGKEEDAGILAYAKDDDAVSADLHRRKACVSLSSEGRNSLSSERCGSRGFSGWFPAVFKQFSGFIVMQSCRFVMELVVHPARQLAVYNKEKPAYQKDKLVLMVEMKVINPKRY